MIKDIHAVYALFGVSVIENGGMKLTKGNVGQPSRKLLVKFMSWQSQKSDRIPELEMVI